MRRPTTFMFLLHLFCFFVNIHTICLAVNSICTIAAITAMFFNVIVFISYGCDTYWENVKKKEDGDYNAKQKLIAESSVDELVCLFFNDIIKVEDVEEYNIRYKMRDCINAIRKEVNVVAL